MASRGGDHSGMDLEAESLQGVLRRESVGRPSGTSTQVPESELVGSPGRAGTRTEDLDRIRRTQKPFGSILGSTAQLPDVALFARRIKLSHIYPFFEWRTCSVLNGGPSSAAPPIRLAASPERPAPGLATQAPGRARPGEPLMREPLEWTPWGPGARDRDSSMWPGHLLRCFEESSLQRIHPSKEDPLQSKILWRERDTS